MSRYFFDYFDGSRSWPDSSGTEHDGIEQARVSARDTLTSFVRADFAGEPERLFWIDVLDGGRHQLERVAFLVTVKAS